MTDSKYIEIKAIDEPDAMPGSFEGDLAVFGNIDLVGDICETGCFDESIRAKGTKRTLLWQHDAEEPIGQFNVIDSQQGTLKVKGSFNLDVERGRAGYSLLKRGDINGLSIGYIVNKATYDEKGIRHLIDVDLMEGSLVTFPANPLATAQAKARTMKGIKDLDEDARNAIIDAVTDEVKKALRKALCEDADEDKKEADAEEQSEAEPTDEDLAAAKSINEIFERKKI